MNETFEIKITKKFSLSSLEEGLFIFMFRANRIPPHLGIITNGKLFDISMKGPNIAIPVKDFYHTVLKRKTEVVFIELYKPNNSYHLENEIANLVKYYNNVSVEVSCLMPIKDFLSTIYNHQEFQNACFIFELLPILNKHHIIKSISQLGLDKKLKNSILEISKYIKKDVENCINALKRKKQILS